MRAGILVRGMEAGMPMRGKWWAAAGARAFLGLLLPAVVTALQLPPEIQADRYLLEAEKEIQEQDFEGAKAAMDRILELQAQHGLELPEQFFFRYAEVVERLGLYDEAVEFVMKYLTLVGRDGEHYREALELLSTAEAAKAAAEEARGRAEAARVAAEEVERRRADAARRWAEETPEAARRWAEETPEAARKRAEAVVAGMEFVRVPAGEFLMGSTSDEADDDEQPLTRVRISRAFELGKHEVRQAEWEAVMESNPSRFDECGGDCPVEQVSWDDVQEFIGRLNALEGEARYRLPTEAEWEYAARAGTSGDRYGGDLDAIAWYEENSEGTHPVGQKVPNAWGLHDMLGNVWEWVQDWNGAYPGGSVTDPQGAMEGSYRLARGGSWIGYARDCRASNRNGGAPGYRGNSLGFRLLRIGE